jgi:hypothetical protein
MQGGPSDLVKVIFTTGTTLALEVAANEVINSINRSRTAKGEQPLSREMEMAMRASPAFAILVFRYIYGVLCEKEPSNTVMLVYFIHQLMQQGHLALDAAGKLSIT